MHKKPHTLGYVLSGGGARGIAHLGVLQALDEAGLKPTHIAGTSAGAVLGAFYSAGFSPLQILELVQSLSLFSFRSFKLGKAGFFSMRPMETVLKKHLKIAKLEELPIPLTVTATDVVRGEVRYFTEGDLPLILQASSCVPLVFKPIEYDGTFFLDGGILDNFPISTLRNKCDKVIGVFVNSISHEPRDIQMRDMLDRSFHLALSSTVESKSVLCDAYFCPPGMSRFGMFSMSQSVEIYEYAYAHAKERMNDADMKQLIAHFAS